MELNKQINGELRICFRTKF